MADIELVIKIPEDIYNHIIVDSEHFTPSLVNAFKNGTPLPKGHGQLVDYDEMKKIAFDYGRYTETALSYVKPRVLIEADKAESEDKE